MSYGQSPKTPSANMDIFKGNGPILPSTISLIQFFCTSSCTSGKFWRWKNQPSE